MKKIIISRTDNIGDVMLTLPLAGFLKTQFPASEIVFIGKKYTKALIETCEHIDFFWDKEILLQNPQMMRVFEADAILFVFPDVDIAKMASQANIPLRIGTAHRWWHWWYGNKRVFFSRKKSDLHESQLNFKLLKPLGFDIVPTLTEITNWYGFTHTKTPKFDIKELVSTDKFSLIFHPKSKGSGKEWGLENFYQLAKSFEDNPNVEIFITGVEAEKMLIMQEKPEIFTLKNVKDYTAKFSLDELIYFMQHCDGLLASSTGTLHIAAALGIYALGIFPPMRPLHPARWQPVGKKVFVFVKKTDCNTGDAKICKKLNICACMQSIMVEEVKNRIGELGIRN